MSNASTGFRFRRWGWGGEGIFGFSNPGAYPSSYIRVPGLAYVWRALQFAAAFQSHCGILVDIGRTFNE